MSIKDLQAGSQIPKPRDVNFMDSVNFRNDSGVDKWYDYSHISNHPQIQLLVGEGEGRGLFPSMRVLAVHRPLASGRGRIVGGVWSTIRSDEDAHLGATELDPDFRGKGLGVRLYETLYRHLLTKGVKNIYNNTTHSTSAARVHAALANKHNFDYHYRPSKDGTDYDDAFGNYKYDFSKAAPEGFPNELTPKGQKENTENARGFLDNPVAMDAYLEQTNHQPSVEADPNHQVPEGRTFNPRIPLSNIKDRMLDFHTYNPNKEFFYPGLGWQRGVTTSELHDDEFNQYIAAMDRVMETDDFNERYPLPPSYNLTDSQASSAQILGDRPDPPYIPFDQRAVKSFESDFWSKIHDESEKAPYPSDSTLAQAPTSQELSESKKQLGKSELIKVFRTSDRVAANMRPHQAYDREAYDKVETYDFGDGYFHHVYYQEPMGDYQSVLHSISTSSDPRTEGEATSASGIHTVAGIGRFENSPWKEGHAVVHGETTSRGPRGLGIALYSQMAQIHGRMVSDSSTSTHADRAWARLMLDPRFTGGMGPDRDHRHWVESRLPEKPKPIRVIHGDGRSLKDLIAQPESPYHTELKEFTTDVEKRHGLRYFEAHTFPKGDNQRVGISGLYLDVANKTLHKLSPYHLSNGFGLGSHYEFQHQQSIPFGIKSAGKQLGARFVGDLDSKLADSLITDKAAARKR